MTESRDIIMRLIPMHDPARRYLPCVGKLCSRKALENILMIQLLPSS